MILFRHGVFSCIKIEGIPACYSVVAMAWICPELLISAVKVLLTSMVLRGMPPSLLLVRNPWLPSLLDPERRLLHACLISCTNIPAKQVRRAADC
jgi:hypothetical protein